MDEHGARALLERVAADDSPASRIDVERARSSGRRTRRHRMVYRSAAPLFAIGLIAGLLTSGVLDGGSSRNGPLTKPTGMHRPHRRPASRIPANSAFLGVTAASPKDGWAVGLTYTAGLTRTGPRHKVLVERWNGSAWAPAPSVGRTVWGTLFAVAANSAGNAWAVGRTQTVPSQSVIEHWNGVAWSRVASPTPRGGGDLYAVAVTSATDAWAVGSSPDSASPRALIEHWNGRTWTVTRSPALAGVGYLYGVAARSAADIWAVGITSYGGAANSVIVHWDGRIWTRVASPGTGLLGVAAISPANAWAVGTYGLIAHWNGRVWTAVRDGILDRLTLSAVAGTSAHDVWAVGWVNPTGRPNRSVILHWNGTAWRRVPAPVGRTLLSVAAASSRDARVVGDDSRGYPLLLHWDGTSWRRQ